MVFNSKHKPVVELFGLPDPPKTGRARLIHAAIELFYSHGFQAVGVDQIIAAAGVTKTTFYKHFESKDDLLVAAIRQRDEWEIRAWTAAVRKMAGDDPRAQLLAFFDVLDIWFNAPDFRGCQFINAAAEFPNPHDPVHAVAAEHKRKNRDFFRDLAAAAGASIPSRSPIGTQPWSKERWCYDKSTVATTPPRSSSRGPVVSGRGVALTDQRSLAFISGRLHNPVSIPGRAVRVIGQ
jgi:AcrR family transcriptional regulator